MILLTTLWLSHHHYHLQMRVVKFRRQLNFPGSQNLLVQQKSGQGIIFYTMLFNNIYGFLHPKLPWNNQYLTNARCYRTSYKRKTTDLESRISICYSQNLSTWGFVFVFVFDFYKLAKLITHARFLTTSPKWLRNLRHCVPYTCQGLA